MEKILADDLRVNGLAVTWLPLGSHVVKNPDSNINLSPPPPAHRTDIHRDPMIEPIVRLVPQNLPGKP